MGKEILAFGNIEIEKNKFHHHESPAPLRDIEIEKVLISNKVFFSEKNYKYFIGCMFLSCHVRILESIHTLYFPECEGTPCSEQTRSLKFK